MNDSEVKRDDVIEVLRKTGLYGTVPKKKEHFDRIIASKNAILTACPETVKTALAEAYLRCEVKAKKTRPSAEDAGPSAEDAAFVFHEFGEIFRVWKSSSRQFLSDRTPQSNVVLRDLKKSTNHMADKVIEAFAEAKLAKEDDIKGAVVANLNAEELLRKYNEKAVVVIDDVEHALFATTTTLTSPRRTLRICSKMYRNIITGKLFPSNIANVELGSVEGIRAVVALRFRVRPIACSALVI